MKTKTYLKVGSQKVVKFAEGAMKKIILICPNCGAKQKVKAPIKPGEYIQCKSCNAGEKSKDWK